MVQPLNIFRIVAAEFSNVDDETVNLWLGLTAPLVSVVSCHFYPLSPAFIIDIAHRLRRETY